MSYSDDWDHYLNNIKSIKAGQKQKDRLTMAVQTMRRNFGEDWLSESKDTPHTILWSLQSMSGAMDEGLLVIWGDYISAVEKSKGFETLRNKLKRHDCFESSLAELEMAGRLASHGCRIEFEPKTGDKVPDLHCHIGESKFFIEVKTLTTANETVKAFKTLTGILSVCRPISPVGQIFKPLSKLHLEKVTSIVVREAIRAVSDKIAIEVDINKILKMYLVPNEMPDRIKMCKEWHSKQEQLGIVPHGSWMSGPKDNVRQEYRVRMKINNFAKKQQIPLDEIGVLVLTGQFLFQDADDVERFVDFVIEDVYDLGNISAVVLVSGKAFGDTKVEIIDRHDFIFIRNHLYGGIQEDIVIIKNQFYKPKFDYENLKSLLLARNERISSR